MPDCSKWKRMRWGQPIIAAVSTRTWRETLGAATAVSPTPREARISYVSSLLVLVLLPAVGSACSVFSERAKCEGTRLRELPLSITALDLSNSSLETLNWTSLAKLDNLEELNMNSCDILLLPADAFLKLHKLVRLDLSFNGLTRLHKDTFKFNTKLRELALDGNELHFDSSSPFLVSYSITRLQLRHCGIQKISNITFRDMKTLKYLDLSGNKINVLHSGAFNYSVFSELKIHPSEEIWSELSKVCGNGAAVLDPLGHSWCQTTKSRETETTTTVEPSLVKAVDTWVPVVVVMLAVLCVSVRLCWCGKRGEKQVLTDFFRPNDDDRQHLNYQVVVVSEGEELLKPNLTD